jgi:hypothetical protein
LESKSNQNRRGFFCFRQELKSQRNGTGEPARIRFEIFVGMVCRRTIAMDKFRTVRKVAMGACESLGT